MSKTSFSKFSQSYENPKITESLGAVAAATGANDVSKIRLINKDESLCFILIGDIGPLLRFFPTTIREEYSHASSEASIPS